VVQNTKTGKLKYTKLPQNVTNGHRIFQMTIKQTKRPLHTPTSYIARLSKMYPNSDFWSENKPSGNPGRKPPLSAPNDLWQKSLKTNKPVKSITWVST
jgi:hypothetical protein